MVQNFHLVWLDRSIDQTYAHWRAVIRPFRELVNTFHIFTELDLCIDFVTDADEAAFVIISGAFDGTLISIISTISPVNKVYIFCEDKPHYGEWLRKYSSISNVYSEITFIYEALKKDIQEYDRNAFPISFVKKESETAKQNLDTLDCSFMYTQLLKDIILTIHFNQEHFQEFMTYCREQFVGKGARQNVDKFEKEYQFQQAIWWYTYSPFLYSMLNRALRMMDVVLIVNMGFFVRDLHNHIVELHSKQYGSQTRSKSFTVYRGQGLCRADFKRLKATEGGLLAFNSFLSTSQDREVSLMFAETNSQQS